MPEFNTETCWSSAKSGYVPKLYLLSSLAHQAHSSLLQLWCQQLHEGTFLTRFKNERCSTELKYFVFSQFDVAESVTRPRFYEAIVISPDFFQDYGKNGTEIFLLQGFIKTK